MRAPRFITSHSHSTHSRSPPPQYACDPALRVDMRPRVLFRSPPALVSVLHPHPCLCRSCGPRLEPLDPHFLGEAMFGATPVLCSGSTVCA